MYCDITEVLNVLWMRLKLVWFKGPLDFQFVTTIGEFRLLSGSFFFLSRLKDQLTAPLQTFPFVQREERYRDFTCPRSRHCREGYGRGCVNNMKNALPQ